jgi:hypothetical protein
MNNQDNQRQAFLYSYLAGIFDGEGTIGIARHKQTDMVSYKYTAYISIGMSSAPILKLISKTFGGNVTKESVLPNRKQIYRWKRSSFLMIEVVDKLLPFLIEKREQAILVRAFVEGYERNLEGKRQCRKCKKQKQIRGYGLCGACYMRMRRHSKLDNFIKNYRLSKFVPLEELRRRERLYIKCKTLNAVGAAATK